MNEEVTKFQEFVKDYNNMVDVLKQKDKIIDLMINDLQEYVYTNQSKEEILEYYKNV